MRKNKPPPKPAPKSPPFSIGEVFRNPYLQTSTKEVLDREKRRAGWLWEHSDGRIIVSPHLGFYVWYAENGEEWTSETGALWLVQHRT